jgi:hypothetical protein
MKRCPLPVLIVAIALMSAGTVGFFYHLQDFTQPDQKIYVTLLVEVLRLTAIVSGILLLKGNNAGRWMSIAWILVHVVISVFNSVTATLMHIVVLVIICTLLFLPASSNYFKRKT